MKRFLYHGQVRFLLEKFVGALFQGIRPSSFAIPQLLVTPDPFSMIRVIYESPIEVMEDNYEGAASELVRGLG